MAAAAEDHWKNDQPEPGIKAVAPDIPATIRAIAERSLLEKTALRVMLRDESQVEAFLKHLRDYGEVREAGRLTLKAAVHDKLTVHFKATLKKPHRRAPT